MPGGANVPVYFFGGPLDGACTRMQGWEIVSELILDCHEEEDSQMGEIAHYYLGFQYEQRVMYIAAHE